MSQTKWVLAIAGAIAVALILGAGALLLVFPPRLRVENIGGPVAIVKGGAPKHGFLGVEFERADGTEKPTVRLAIPGTGAAQAGIQPGDVIRSIDGKSITSASEIREWLLNKPPGAVVLVGIMRGTQTISLAVELIGFNDWVILNERHKAGPPQP